MIGRRGFLSPLGVGIAAPAIAKASALMPVKGERCLLATVNASYQSGSGLIVNPLSRALNVGDILTIEGVRAWHRNDDKPSDQLRQFVVTASAEAGHGLIFLYPPIIGEHPPRYRSVVNLPMSKAEVRRQI